MIDALAQFARLERLQITTAAFESKVIVGLISTLVNRMPSLISVKIDQGRLYGDEFMEFTVLRDYESGGEPKISVNESGELEYVF